MAQILAQNSAIILGGDFNRLGESDAVQRKGLIPHINSPQEARIPWTGRLFLRPVIEL